MKDLCVFLDAGHGALDRSGNYLTAPAKQFEHAKGTFHKGRWFYEGVWNRTLTNRVAQKLWNLRISYIIVSHEYLDTSLEQRVSMANWYHRNYKEGIFISNHSNAGGGAARGFEVYSSRGTTQSDKLADIQYNNVKDLLSGRIAMRPDTSDKDNDKEAGFYVIVNTVMPAILNEHLFFDNYEDAMLLMNDDIVDLFAEAQVRTVIQWFNL